MHLTLLICCLGHIYFFEILQPSKVIPHHNDLPILQYTSLVWLVSGNIPKSPHRLHSHFSTCNITLTNVVIHDQLEKFWEVDNIEPKPNDDSNSCESCFMSTHTRQSDGR